MAQGFGASFVGRSTELDQLGELLSTRSLVTVVGEGGVGKTRLARELAGASWAAEWSRFWVDLGAADGAAGVRAAFEDALRPTERSTSFEGLIEERVPDGPGLLVVDNCEHVLDDISRRLALIGELRPATRILATSRARLGVNGEVVYRLAPLTIPSAGISLGEAGDVAAVALLADRLHDVVPGFDLTPDNAAEVVALARRTEGVPLAIELVAASASAVPLGEILRGLPDAPGPVDVRREPRRHRSLDASVRWSVDRLGAPAAEAFRRLGVFADSFSFASAVRVVSDSGDRDDAQATRSFVELVEASLVRRLDDDRYSLPMAVRTFAQEELGSGDDAAVVRDRHARIVLDLVVVAAAALVDPEQEHESWLAALDAELPEIRAAIDWQLRCGRPGHAAALLLHSYDHAHMRGRYGEVFAQCRRVLADPALDRAASSRLSAAASITGVMAGRLDDGYDFAARAVADSDVPVVRGTAHLDRAWSGFYTGRIDESTLWEDLDEALRLARQHGDDDLETAALERRGALEVQARSIPAGRERLVALAGGSGPAPLHRPLAARVFATYGPALFGLELDELTPQVDDLVDDCRSLGHVAYQSMALASAGTIATLRGDEERAERLLAEAERLTRDHELPTFQNVVQRWYAFSHYGFERSDAIERARRALELAESTGNAWDAVAAHWLIGLLSFRLDDDEAPTHLRIAAERSADPGYPFSRIRAELALALVDLRDGEPAAGLARCHDVLRRADEYGDVHGLAAALDHLARLECERAAFDRAGRFAGAADALLRPAGVVRLPCERDLRTSVEQRLVDDLGADATRTIIEEGHSLDRTAAVRLAARSRGRRSRPVSGWESLTPTEREVAELAGEGLTNRAIAARLFMSVNTVKTHLSHVYSKVGVPGRSGLAAELARRTTGT